MYNKIRIKCLCAGCLLLIGSVPTLANPLITPTQQALELLGRDNKDGYTLIFEGASINSYTLPVAPGVNLQVAYQDAREHIHKDLLNDDLIQAIYVSNINLQEEQSIFQSQWSTGEYWDVNCLPACTVTLVNWISMQSQAEVEPIRDYYEPSGGYMYTDQMTEVFDNLGVDYDHVSFDEENIEERLLAKLNTGNLVMVVTDIDEISTNHNANSLEGKSYSSDGWHHSYIILGYYQTEDALFYEVFDPYENQTSIRYFESNQVYDSILDHWDWGLVVPRQDAPMTLDPLAQSSL